MNKSFKQTRWVIVIVLSAILGTTVIGYRSMRTPSEPTSLPTVTIALVTFPGYAPLYVAKEKNLFPGITVELVRIESIGDLRAAMASRRIDIYAATYDIFQSIKDSIPEGIGFLAVDESHGADGIVVNQSIKSIDGLRGKIVGTEPGFPASLILQDILDHAGMQLSDIQLKDMASQDVGGAFVSGELDAAGTYEPYLSASQQKRPGSTILVSSRDAPGLIVDFLFASDTLAVEHPEYLKSVADGWFAAVEYYNNNPEESLKIMANAFGVTPQEMSDFKQGVSWLTLDDNRTLFDRSHSRNAFEMFTRVGNLLKKFGNTNVSMNAEDKLTDAIINQYDR